MPPRSADLTDDQKRRARYQLQNLEPGQALCKIAEGLGRGASVPKLRAFAQVEGIVLPQAPPPQAPRFCACGAPIKTIGAARHAITQCALCSRVENGRLLTGSVFAQPKAAAARRARQVRHG